MTLSAPSDLTICVPKRYALAPNTRSPTSNSVTAAPHGFDLSGQFAAEDLLLRSHEPAEEANHERRRLTESGHHEFLDFAIEIGPVPILGSLLQALHRQGDP